MMLVVKIYHKLSSQILGKRSVPLLLKIGIVKNKPFVIRKKEKKPSTSATKRQLWNKSTRAKSEIGIDGKSMEIDKKKETKNKLNELQNYLKIQ